MQLTHEHQELKRNLKRFIDDEINPHVDEWEAAEQFPAHEVFRKLGRLGLLGLTKPEAYGGAGLDYSYAVVMAETLGHIHCGAIPMAIGVQTDMATPALARFGSEALCRQFLEPAIAGEQVGCIGVSEPGAGSDVASVKTTARKDGDDYIINGGKMWITNSLQADWMCLLANTGDGPAHRNKSLIIVPMNTPGVTASKPLKKMGMHASDTAQLHFDNVRVPQRYLIGEEGMGFIYQMEQFQIERLWGAMNNVGMAQRAIDTTIAYTRERQAFGRAILDNQSVHYKLAEYQAELECLRAVCWQAIEQIVDGQDATYLATVAKLKAGRLMRVIADGCLQFWGGMGFVDESPISRIYRDGRLTSIGGGADEVMLQILSKSMGILPR